MAKKQRREQPVVEDLDVDVDFVDDEDTLVHNKRKRNRTESQAVVARDAHRSVDEEEDYEQEEELASQAAKAARRSLTDADFTIGSLSAALPKKRSNEHKPMIEAVERDFSALANDERRALLLKEAPELVAMLQEVQKYMEEVKNIADPLQFALHNTRKSSDEKDVLSFLETKVQLMLSYCLHVTFYLLLKTEGKQVKGHPVLDRLVELRVYLEKIRPLEEKLQYTINKLLSTASGQHTGGMNVSGLRAIAQEENGIYQPIRTASTGDSGKQRRLERKAAKEQADIEREELSAMTRFQTRKSTPAKSTLEAAIRPADEGYHEDEDQFFAQMVEGMDDDEAGMSLIDRLQKRNANANKKKAPVVVPDDVEDEMSGEEDMLDEEDYEQLLEEEKGRNEHASRLKSLRKAPSEPAEVDRRKIGKQIEAHRGLTKSRPKDRKTPRTAQRRKFERGMQKVKSQSKTAQPEPEEGFVGVRSLRPNVTHSTKFK